MIKTIHVTHIDKAGFVEMTETLKFKNEIEGINFQERMRNVKNALTTNKLTPHKAALVVWNVDGLTEGYFKESR